MNKKLSIIILSILTLLFASCSSTSDGRSNSFELDSFNGGDDALTFGFLDEAPPELIRDQGLQPFQVMLSIKNNGEFDIPADSAYVSLTGFRPQDLGLTETSKPISAMNGFKKQGSNVIEGRTQQVIFSNLKYTESVVSGSFPIKIYANVCYPYQTRSFTRLCINGNTVPALDKRGEICDLNSQREYANSGAPISIENVQQYPAGSSSISFQFEIVHTETSQESNVYESGSIDSNCNINGFSSTRSSEAILQRDKITYEVDTGLPGLNCESTGTNSNTVDLTNDRYTVVCTQDTTGEGEYEKAATITLNYDYLDRISTDILVEHFQR
jgi:hypothetical protein